MLNGADKNMNEKPFTSLVRALRNNGANPEAIEAGVDSLETLIQSQIQPRAGRSTMTGKRYRVHLSKSGKRLGRPPGSKNKKTS